MGGIAGGLQGLIAVFYIIGCCGLAHDGTTIKNAAWTSFSAFVGTTSIYGKSTVYTNLVSMYFERDGSVKPLTSTSGVYAIPECGQAADVMQNSMGVAVVFGLLLLPMTLLRGLGQDSGILKMLSLGCLFVSLVTSLIVVIQYKISCLDHMTSQYRHQELGPGLQCMITAIVFETVVAAVHVAYNAPIASLAAIVFPEDEQDEEMVDDEYDTSGKDTVPAEEFDKVQAEIIRVKEEIERNKLKKKNRGKKGVTFNESASPPVSPTAATAAAVGAAVGQQAGSPLPRSALRSPPPKHLPPIKTNAASPQDTGARTPTSPPMPDPFGGFNKALPPPRPVAQSPPPQPDPFGGFNATAQPPPPQHNPFGGFNATAQPPSPPQPDPFGGFNSNPQPVEKKSPPPVPSKFQPKPLPGQSLHTVAKARMARDGLKGQKSPPPGRPPAKLSPLGGMHSPPPQRGKFR